MAYVAPPPDDDDRAEAAAVAGLCATCRHLQVLRSRRSVFVRCSRSDREAGYPRYPPLPVRFCPGWEEAAEPPVTGSPVDRPPGRR